MMDGWSMGAGDGWVAMVLVIAFIGAVVAVLVIALGHGRAPTHAPTHAPPNLPDGTDTEADLILQRRFAAGEIDEDEYLQRRSLLHDRF